MEHYFRLDADSGWLCIHVHVVFNFGVGSCLELSSKCQEASNVDSDCETFLIRLWFYGLQNM